VIEGRYVELGGYAGAYATRSRGKIVFRYADDDEVFEAADACYGAPSPLPLIFAGTELVELSSTDLVASPETNVAPDGPIHPDVSCDLTLPQWRLRTEGVDAIVRVRLEGQPDPEQR
jgi:hypothetical protein